MRNTQFPPDLSPTFPALAQSAGQFNVKLFARTAEANSLLFDRPESVADRFSSFLPNPFWRRRCNDRVQVSTDFAAGDLHQAFYQLRVARARFCGWTPVSLVSQHL